MVRWTNLLKTAPPPGYKMTKTTIQSKLDVQQIELLDAVRVLANRIERDIKCVKKQDVISCDIAYDELFCFLKKTLRVSRKVSELYGTIYNFANSDNTVSKNNTCLNTYDKKQ